MQAISTVDYDAVEGRINDTLFSIEIILQDKSLIESLEWIKEQTIPSMAMCNRLIFGEISPQGVMQPPSVDDVIDVRLRYTLLQKSLPLLKGSTKTTMVLQ